jgi:hypothetical protein
MLKKIAFAAVAALAMSGAAAAQNNSGGGGNNSKSEGLVNVSLGDVVLQQIAQDLNVNVADLADITNVQVPVGIAANVCNVAANVLAQQKNEGTATCDAQTSSQALAQAVQRQMGGTQN